jgi:predicted dinucleotide-binding enzyme
MGMKIAILGAGAVGGALAKGWAKAGHELVIAARDPASEKVRALAADTGGRAAGIAEAVAGAEAVFLATPWRAVADALKAAGSLAGRILIDATNPLKPDLSGLDVAPGGSGASAIAAMAPGARVVKCFNQTGWENMAGARFAAGRPVMFVAGDDADANAAVMRLAEDVGFEALDAGGLATAPMLENLAMLWIHLMVKRGAGRAFAFGLLRR